jgi:hypothetical protein
MVDHLQSKNFVPFSRRRDGFRLPGMRKDRDEEMLEQVDPDMRPEDEGVIRRYLQYADILLGSPDHHGLTLVQGGRAAKRLAGNAEPAAREQTAPREQKTAREQRALSRNSKPAAQPASAEQSGAGASESSPAEDDEAA